jgi:hypothetical protein
VDIKLIVNLFGVKVYFSFFLFFKQNNKLEARHPQAAPARTDILRQLQQEQTASDSLRQPQTASDSLRQPQASSGILRHPQAAPARTDSLRQPQTASDMGAEKNNTCA